MVAAELERAGLGECATEEGGVTFRGGARELYRANLHLRVASRILVRLATFRATAFHELERNAKRIGWSDFFPPGARVRLRVTCRKSRLYHSDAVAERIAGVLSARSHVVAAHSDDADEVASDADDAGPGESDQLVVVRLFHDRCTISADSSGNALYMRGYREAAAKAPLRETLASALLQASLWHADLPLLDPMCGSGTIAIEAALAARHIAPGISRADRQPRSFAFQRWPNFDAAAWQGAVDAARGAILERAPAVIQASDRDAGAGDAARANAARAGVADDVEVDVAAVSSIGRVADAGAVVCNPPYGKRLGDEKALRDLYARLGRVLRERFGGWSITMLSASRLFETQMGLRFSLIARTNNGGIPVRIVRATII